ncbi:MAG: SURF1 family protein [Gammaproteobacteria bacterium]|nr:MAG: SURF1 family protein [Gammaproteobacteria bacterium]
MIDRQYNARASRPPSWATAATVLGLMAFLALGYWQLQRAEEKRSILADAERGREETLTALPAADLPEPLWRYRTVVLTGRYEAGRQILLDNMTQDGQVGYQVLTPFWPDGGGMVLVNRGWLAAEGPRGELPVLEIDETRRELVGQLNRLPRPGLRLGGNDPGAPGDPWPRRFLYPEHVTLAAAFGEPLADLQVQLAPDQPGGYSRRWEVVNMPPERHLGYAVQWFAFAAVLLVIYVWLGFFRGRKLER